MGCLWDRKGEEDSSDGVIAEADVARLDGDDEDGSDVSVVVLVGDAAWDGRVDSCGRIAGGGYRAKNRINRGGRFFARLTYCCGLVAMVAVLGEEFPG